MKQEQIDKIYGLIAKNFRVDKNIIKPEMTFEKDLNADSLDVVELFIDIEDEFGLEINIEELQGKVSTVQDAVDAISKLMESR
jgi:acyl carrier protein